MGNLNTENKRKKTRPQPINARGRVSVVPVKQATSRGGVMRPQGCMVVIAESLTKSGHTGEKHTPKKVSRIF